MSSIGIDYQFESFEPIFRTIGSITALIFWLSVSGIQSGYFRQESLCS
jgi:site-specific recombinase